MARIAVIARGANAFALSLAQALRLQRPTIQCDYVPATGASVAGYESCIYIPALCDRQGMVPDLAEASLFERPDFYGKKFILLSSAVIYGTGPARQSLVGEDYAGIGGRDNYFAGQWQALESLACRYLRNHARLTILRPTTVFPSPTLLSRRLMRRLTLTLPGHDPVIQLLTISGLAQAVLGALDYERESIFNVAPDDVVPLHVAIRIAGNHRLPIPRTLQRLFVCAEALDYIRYPWTISNQRIRQELGLRPQTWSAFPLLSQRDSSRYSLVAKRELDEFGMDKTYIEFFSRTLFEFLSRWYWRIEAKGLEHVPRQGRAVLVGTHRGFMPCDGMMALHLVVKSSGRVPRFLTHPGLLKFPFISNFVRKLGGVIASQESADRILQNEELLGVFPEGIEGAFALYRQAYQLKSFGRDSFVKLALRNRAPLIPFVTVGSAEALPIFARIKSRRWRRYADWPCIPLSTFPFIPVPLPSKWHTEFLPAIHLEQRYGPEAAEDRRVVKSIGQEIRNQMQTAVNKILSRRPSVFFGSVFRKGNHCDPAGM